MSIFFSFLSVLPAFHTIFIGIDVFVLNSLASFTLLPRPGLVATPSRYREPTTPSRAKTAAQRLALPLHVLQPRPTVQRCRGSIGNSDFFFFSLDCWRVVCLFASAPFDELLICPSCSPPSPQRSAGTDSSTLRAR